MPVEYLRYGPENFPVCLKQEELRSQVPVAHTCNPSYSGSTDQEDHGSKPAQANSLRDPISKIPNTKQE
jgi:hypothetical protein